jgi:hypothetical protein
MSKIKNKNENELINKRIRFCLKTKLCFIYPYKNDMKQLRHAYNRIYKDLPLEADIHKRMVFKQLLNALTTTIFFIITPEALSIRFLIANTKKPMHLMTYFTLSLPRLLQDLTAHMGTTAGVL